MVAAGHREEEDRLNRELARKLKVMALAEPKGEEEEEEEGDRLSPELIEHAKQHRGLEARVKELEEELAEVRRLNAGPGTVPEAVPLPLPPPTPVAVVVEAPTATSK